MTALDKNPAAATPGPAKLTRKDFASDQEVRWCPGCGDYSILAQVQRVLPELGIPPEQIVFVSGIGCSSRFPYYMNTYGIHGIHGRAPAIATGVKLANPALQVWVVSGDGDALSIGGNHIIHMLRRNMDIKVLVFNNRIYGLTKGQFSPTSEFGKKTKSTPYGSRDYPFNPLSLALGADATFVARTIDSEPKHLQEVLRRVAAHKGSAFVEIYQNCVVFNDGAFDAITDKETKAQAQLVLENGMPMLFGKNKEYGIRLRGYTPEVVRLGEGGITAADVLVHNEKDENPTLAFLLSRMTPPEFPTPIGVFRAVRRPTFSEAVHQQIAEITAAKGTGDLEKLFAQGDTWVVPESPASVA
jgi:2-oxoglutarate ferredoxin oxidoreductase subunit beta